MFLFYYIFYHARKKIRNFIIREKENKSELYKFLYPLMTNYKIRKLSFRLTCTWNCGKYERAPEDSVEKVEAKKRLLQQISHRTHVDNSMKLITEILFGRDSTTALLAAVRPPGQPLLDDWSCLKSLVSYSNKR